jgi:NADH/F420H2 dehydrogenase subunit C
VTKEELVSAVSTKFPDVTGKADGPLAIVQVPPAKFREVMVWLHNDASMSLDYPMSQTAIDYPAEKKLTSVYHLYSMKHSHKLVVKVDLDREKPVIPTVSDLWRGCEWFERETYDMFGIVFEGHPDLRRIMLTEDWVGFPLRKDYVDSRMATKPF